MYRLQIGLIKGSGLVVRDSSGSSDPYVVFFAADKQLGKSRVIRQCLEPSWDEKFEFSLDNLNGDLELRVYDWDALSPRDDYMGRCLLPLAALCPGQQLSLRLPLADETGQAREASMGDLHFTTELNLTAPVATPESATVSESIVTVGLIDVVGLSSFGLDGEEASQACSRPLYAQLQLGDQLCRSRLTRRGPIWDEELRMTVPSKNSSAEKEKQQQQQLDVCIFERHLTSQDILVGRARVPIPDAPSASGGDLIAAPLLDYATGGPAVRLILDLLPASQADKIGNTKIEDEDDSFKFDSGIGYLAVRILDAERLKSGGNASAIFCTLRLNNSQLSTHVIDSDSKPNNGTEPRRHCRELKFRVRDLHSELELTVYEENKRQSPPQLLGRLALRLPQLLDNADARGKQTSWYGLKDKRLEAWTGGRLKLETRLRYSWLGAAVQTIGPKEPRLWGLPEPKLRLRLVRRDTRRCVAVIETLSRLGAFTSSCFHWEDPVRSATALACYVAIVWNLQPFMLPLVPLALLLVNLSKWLTDTGPEIQKSSTANGPDLPADEMTAESDDEADIDERSWLQRARAAQELLLRLQDGLDAAASSAERLRNLVQWREPRITCLAAALLVAAALVLGLLPLRLLALAWGVNKFSKRLLRPDADDSNELLNLLSRVPSDIDLERTRLLPPP